jgi:serine/threonine-protein kinase
MPAALGAFQPGSQVAGYLLEEQIGAGGMAVVFRAHDIRLDRTVALKILAPGLAADEAFRQRFVRESRAAAAVDDPHIIPVFEAGESQGVLFIAMRFVPGGDARSLVARSGPLPPRRAAEMISQVASALDAAHGRGLVHRDVKPANILLDAGGRQGRREHVYLSDFGLSKTALSGSGLTGTGMFLGTLDYVAPEQIEGRPVDGRTDEYALACAAFELLTAAPPFPRDDAPASMHAHLSEPPPTVTGRRPDLPASVDAVVAHALAKAPADRYPSCREFAEALRAALGMRPYDLADHAATYEVSPPTELTADMQHARPAAAAPAQPVAAHRAPAPGRAWPRSLLVLAAAAVVLAASGAAYLALHSSHRGPTNPGGRGVRAEGTAALTVPRCGAGSATGASLSAHVSTRFSQVSAGSSLFGIAAAPDGKFVFAVQPKSVVVLALGPGLRLAYQASYPLAGTTQTHGAGGAALTRDGKYLLVAVGSGIDVMSVAGLEGTGSAAVGTLTVPGLSGYGRGIQVAVTPNDQYAFVALQFANQVAVFNLGQAVSSGFSQSGYVGSLNVGAQPVGVTVSRDGRWLYTANWGSSPGQGAVSVIRIATAASDPKNAIVSQATGLCNPSRIALSPSGAYVWVSDRLSNHLLAFSAARLRATPGRALVATVEVGQNPVGVAVVNGGSRIVVLDANDTRIGLPTLAVINVASALAGKPALLGYITGGQGARELAMSPNRRYLYIADVGTAQVQVVDLATLP